MDKMESYIKHCNCFDGMKELPDNSIDFVFIDPPYGINYKYLSYDDTRENLIELIDKFMPELKRLSKRIAIFTGVQNIWLYPQADWIFSYSWNTTATYGFCGYNQWQPVIFYGKDIKGFGSVNGVLKSDSLKLSGGSGVGFLRSEKIKNHPCPKPMNVIKYFINRLSNENEIVLDIFMGSGTLPLACLELNRKYIGFEIDKTYYDITEKRINEYKQQLKLF